VDTISPSVKEVKLTSGHDSFVNAQLAIRMIGSLKSLPDTKGLHETVVYSVLDDNEGAGLVNVPAKDYSVDCSHRTSNAVVRTYPDGRSWLANLYLDGAKQSAGYTLIFATGMLHKSHVTILYVLTHSTFTSGQLHQILGLRACA